MTASALRAELLPPPPTAAPSAPRHLFAVPTLDLADVQIPDPSPKLIRAIAAKSFECVEGSRHPSTMGTMITVSAARGLEVQRAALQERHCVYQHQRQSILNVGNTRVCRLMAEVAEASTVVHTEHRTHAVAMRLEWVHSKWRARKIYVM